MRLLQGWHCPLQVTPRIRGLPPLTEQMAAQYDFKYQKKAESLLAVDEQIDAVVQVRHAGAQAGPWATCCAPV